MSAVIQPTQSKAIHVTLKTRSWSADKDCKMDVPVVWFVNLIKQATLYSLKLMEFSNFNIRLELKIIAKQNVKKLILTATT